MPLSIRLSAGVNAATFLKQFLPLASFYLGLFYSAFMICTKKFISSVIGFDLVYLYLFALSVLITS